MTCRHCHLPVILQPSAKARAERYGGAPRDYTLLFPNHADCVVKARVQETIDLLRSLNSDQ